MTKKDQVNYSKRSYIVSKDSRFKDIIEVNKKLVYVHLDLKQAVEEPFKDAHSHIETAGHLTQLSIGIIDRLSEEIRETRESNPEIWTWWMSRKTP
jgi:hypothetical protein